MPYILDNLVIDRVDLVDEGANSASFIKLYKRKERCAIMEFNDIISKMKPEHAEVVLAEVNKAKDSLAEAEQNLQKAKDDLAAATTEVETLKAAQKQNCECDGEEGADGMCKACGKPKKKAAFDEEEVLKSMPAAAREMFAKMRAQKEAAEEEVRKAKEAEKTAEAIAKAAELKALPIDNDKLVGILKSCSSDMVDVLSTINAAIEGTVLTEVGKSYAGSAATADAWSKIEAKASEIVKRDNVTKQKAVSTAIKENPELYKEYLQGGAN